MSASDHQPSLLFVAPSAYELGGVATWLDYIVPGLADRGHAVSVALAEGKFHDVERYSRAHSGLRALPVANATGSREGRVQSLMRTIRRAKPDLVLAVNIADCSEAIVRLRERSDGAAPRLLMTVHGIQPDLFDDVARETAVLDGVACSNCLAVSLANAAGVPRERVHYVPYGVPSVDRSHPAERWTESDAVVRIAYVGRIEQWQKRVFDIVPIAEQLHRNGVRFELLVAGAGPDETALREELRRRLPDGTVRWLGHVPAERVAEEVYAKADVLINPSLWETGPIVAWEAMAYGVVVVSSRYIGSGLEAALVDGVNCRLFDIGDTLQAAVAIASLVDSGERERLSSAAGELVDGRYSLDASIESWDLAIRHTLAQPELAATRSRPASPSGRLDRLLGPVVGESIRRTLGIRFAHAEPGGEWPHSYGETRLTDPNFWQRAAQLDGVRDLAGRFNA